MAELVRSSSIQSTFNSESFAQENVTDKPVVHALKYKHSRSYPENDLARIRELLKIERSLQGQEEFDFWAADYQRMLRDDWLVTRFLIRGTKRNQLNAKDGSREAAYLTTMNLIKACAKFRHDFRVNYSTEPDEFPIEWVKVNGVFSYKSDLVGNPTIHLRIGMHKPKLIASKSLRHLFKRYLLYNLEKSDQELANRPGKLLCCVFDMSSANFENVDLEIVSWMVKSFKICGPKLISYTIVYNLPWFFNATFKLISNTLLSNSNRQSLKFVYGEEILNYISYQNLPDHIRDGLH